MERADPKADSLFFNGRGQHIADLFTIEQQRISQPMRASVYVLLSLTSTVFKTGEYGCFFVTH